MRFQLGPVPTSPDFILDETWKPLREPSPLIFQFMAVPVGLLPTFLMVTLWYFLTPLPKAIPNFSFSVVITAMLLLSIMTIFHESLHMIMHPKSGRTQRSILGFWPSQLMFYAHYDGELTRNRYLSIFAMPILCLSIIPLLLSAALYTFSSWIAFVSITNVAFAAGDIFGMILFVCQLPPKAIVRNQGWKSYWRDQTKTIE